MTMSILEDLRNITNDDYDGEDRISALPDEIIHLIFSFLDAKLAVETCVLSKRWVKLWTTLPYLNFEPPNNNYPYYGTDFISPFLLNRNEKSQTLTVKLDCSDYFINKRVIDYAIFHHVKHLHILGYLTVNGYLDFPLLETLHLTNTSQILEYWSLPSLTTLHLKRTTASNIHNKSFSFDGFDRLKELTLEECDEFGVMEVIFIKCPNLERLTISEGICFKPVCKFVISTPKLSHFALCGYRIPALSAEGGFPYLKEVDLDFINNWEENLIEEVVIQKLNCLFNEFSGTKFLTLSSRTIKVLMEYSRCWPSPFCNLKNLHLRAENISISHVINYLLHSSPGVKIFIQEYNGRTTNYNPEEDLLLYDTFRYCVLKPKTGSSTINHCMDQLENLENWGFNVVDRICKQ